MIEMVPVAQLVEHPVVVRDVAGSSPVWHPTHPRESRGTSLSSKGSPERVNGEVVPWVRPGA